MKLAFIRCVGGRFFVSGQLLAPTKFSRGISGPPNFIFRCSGLSDMGLPGPGLGFICQDSTAPWDSGTVYPV